jgi:hypothetical protein
MIEQKALADLIARYATADGTHATPIPRLSLLRISNPTEPIHALHEPALCIVVQGRKQVILGDRIYR